MRNADDTSSTRAADVDLNAIAQAVGPPCCVIDPDSDRVLAANAAAAGLFGVEDLAGLRFSALHPGTVPQLIVFAEEVFDRGRAWSRRLTGRRSDGTALSLEYEASAIETPQGRRLVFIAVDLTERARRESARKHEPIETGTALRRYASAHGGGRRLSAIRQRQLLHDTAIGRIAES